MENKHAEEPIDLVIIGAGAAGLGLLIELNLLGYQKTIKILERNSGPSNDRIWSFWRSPQLPHRLNAMITKQWAKWELSIGQHSFIMEDNIHQYCSIRSEDFSRLALETAAMNPLHHVEFNCDVKAVKAYNGLTTLTTQNEKIVARKVIDTRPPKLKDKHQGLVQCFFGEEIEVDIDIFNPSCVKLMEHLQVSDCGIEFVYILPFSKRHALVEFTCFNVSPINKVQLKDRLHEALQKLVGNHSFNVLRSESAVLPMYSIDKNRGQTNQNLSFAGIAGGAMRASTGYSFLNSQRWAKHCANALNTEDKLIHKAPIHFVYRAMDKLMLSVIREDMSKGVRIFELMFKKVQAARFARFMTEQATLIDMLAVVWAMPKRPFLGALLRSLFITIKTNSGKSNTHYE